MARTALKQRGKAMGPAVSPVNETEHRRRQDTSETGQKKKCKPLSWKAWLKISVLIVVVTTIIVTFVVFWDPPERIGIRVSVLY